MGRSSRRKRERREDPIWQAFKAETRGRLIPPTPDGYHAALKARGVEGVVEGLYSRSNQRWMNLYRHRDALANSVLPYLSPIGLVQAVGESLGADRERLPGSPYGSVHDHLMWGLDGAIATSRMLLLGQIIGAAALARTQLERWTLNLANSEGIDLSFDQFGGPQMQKPWDAHQQPVDAVGLWSSMSDVLHGRGRFVELARWESVDLLGSSPPKLLDEAAAWIAPSVLQLRSVMIGQAMEADLTVAERLLRQWPESLPFVAPFDFPASAVATMGVWPMLPHHVNDLDQIVALAGPSARLCASRDALAHQGLLAFSVEEMSALVLADHRYRAWKNAATAFIHEEAEVGAAYNPEVLAIRAQHVALTAEAAALVGAWLDTTPGADSLWVASSALRSAFNLWLEDDDRSVACVRTVLESIARARSWRTKPARAAKVRDGAITRDWLDVAGWRRLALLNRSLGELAHVSLESKWSEARTALVHAIPPTEVGDPLKTARGAVLRVSVALLAVEVVEWTRTFSSALANALDEIYFTDQGIEATDEEKWLDQLWDARDVAFGKTEFEWLRGSAPPAT
jgi:hypothetical protein